MIINRAYRYELKPNISQRILLAKHAGCARFAYNWGLARRIELYQAEKKSTNAMAQHRALNKLKQTDFPWMYEVSKCAPQEALRDLDRAFKNFFTGLKAGEKIGSPKFKKKGVHDSFRLTGAIKVEEKAVQLPRLGIIRLKEESAIGGRILSATVSREADRWFVSFSCEVAIPDPEPVFGDAVGIDVGLHHFAAMSDGTKIEASKPLGKYLKRLKRLSKKHSRMQKGSNNRKKSALGLARLHRRIRNSRRDFIHKLTTELAKTKSEIVIEDLNVRGMLQNDRLSRHIADVGWGEFRRQLAYKTVWYGSTLILAPRFYPSSKTCSSCGYVMDSMPLSIREWDCPCCGVHHDRDINAAVNLKKYARIVA
ncbi:putative transposase [Pelotomaculum schinkii]|uniref:Putative transposase n=1 Tax=Pelotomaculum schinkii TaxID=78350 RepID=A0A4Y7R7N1_9FIRM|nr:RNA-guided endonuclease TnpB family protein [Pelotomaculum schinkii]TEB04776.1 putative transposase [Pelotomaculum schinkii]